MISVYIWIEFEKKLGRADLSDIDEWLYVLCKPIWIQYMWFYGPISHPSVDFSSLSGITAAQYG